MATKLFLRSTQLNGIGANYFDMVVAAGSGTTTAVANTAASGTEIQWTQSAGGSVLQFISGRVPVGGFTLTSTDLSIWAQESNAQANSGGRYRVFKRAANGTETEIGGGPFNDGVEFGASAAEMTWVGNVTDTAFAEDDRILVKIYVTNVGTMGGSRTCTLTFNGADGSTGDSFLNIAETVTFKGENQALSPSLFTDSDSFPAPAVTSVYGLTPGLLANAQSFFAPTVSQAAMAQDLTPSLVTNSQSFFASTVGATYALAPSLLTGSQAFHAATVAPGAVALTPGPFTNASTFFAPTVAASYALTAALLSNAQSFPAATIAAGAVSLAPSLVTNAASFHAPTVAPGAVALMPSLAVNGASFPGATVSPGSVGLVASLLTNSAAFHSPIISQDGGSQALLPSLASNTPSFFSPALSGSYTITAPLHTGSQTFHGPTVAAGAVNLSPSLVGSSNAFLSPALEPGPVSLTPALAVNDNAFFAPEVGGSFDLTLEPARFDNVIVFPVHRVRRQGYWLAGCSCPRPLLGMKRSYPLRRAE